MASAGKRPAGQAAAPPVSRIVVVLERATQQGGGGRVEAPDRVLRMWSLLSEADEELRLVSGPAQSLAQVRQLFCAVRAELEHSVSPDLAEELHRLVRAGPAEPDIFEMRIECAGLLGWVSGLVLEILQQLEAVKAGLAPEEEPTAPAEPGKRGARRPGGQARRKRPRKESAHVVPGPG